MRSKASLEFSVGGGGEKRAFGLRLGSWKAATGQQVFAFYLPKLTTLDEFFENLKKICTGIYFFSYLLNFVRKNKKSQAR